MRHDAATLFLSGDVDSAASRLRQCLRDTAVVLSPPPSHYNTITPPFRPFTRFYTHRLEMTRTPTPSTARWPTSRESVGVRKMHGRQHDGPATVSRAARRASIVAAMFSFLFPLTTGRRKTSNTTIHQFLSSDGSIGSRSRRCFCSRAESAFRDGLIYRRDARRGVIA